MKTVSKSVILGLILAFTSFTTFGTAVQQPASLQSITVLTTQYQNLFVFKAGREFKHALVEVYYSNGDLVASKPLDKKKMVINFCDVKPGVYTIRVKKDNRVQEFQFIRK